jgi:hypothetical protein
MRIDKFSFGRITIDGVTYEHDVVIDHGHNRETEEKSRPSGANRRVTEIPTIALLQRELLEFNREELQELE